MLKVILDTDMGADCDDAVALGILLKAEKKKQLELVAVTASTTREGATATVEAICSYYGAKKPTARLLSPVLECDKMDNYAKAVKEKYGTADTDADAVELLRKTLAESEDKITLIAVGPLTNIAHLLQSKADKISPLSGKELVAAKVDKVYIMGGSFTINNDAIGKKSGERVAEWNILQDVGSAAYVAENLPVESVWVPHEAGIKVFTTMGVGDNPVWYSMFKFTENNGLPTAGAITRHSWDPIACLVSFDDLSEYFDLSPKGNIFVHEGGYTEWRDGDGRARFLIVKGNFEKLGNHIDALMAE